MATVTPDRRGLRTEAFFVVVVLLAVALTTLGSPAAAVETETFRLEPHPLKVQGVERRTFSFDVPAGGSVSDSIRIVNLTEEARQFRIYATDAFQQRESGDITILQSSEEPTAVGTWINVDDDQLALLPRSGAIIGFTLTRPAQTESEGFGAIVVEEVRDLPDEGGIDVVYRLAILVTLDGEQTGLSVTDPTLEMPIGLVPSTGTTSATVTNDTLHPVDTTVRFEVESLTGRVWPLDPVEVRLDPGESRVVSQDWTTVPRWGGVLQVKAEVHWEAGSASTTSPRGVYPPLWMLAVLIGLTGIRAIRIMWDDRRRRRRPTRGDGPPPLPRDQTPAEEREPALV